MPIIFRLIARKARSFLCLPISDQVLFMFAYGLLGAARLTLLALPFRRIAPWLGERILVAGFSYLLDAVQIRQARRIGRLVRLAAGYTPWKSRCLVQAMAAMVLLSRKHIPYTLYLGVTVNEVEGMQAHAWVSAGPVYVTGYDGFRYFTMVSAFISPAPMLLRQTTPRASDITA
jgi:hypothetical protein